MASLPFWCVAAASMGAGLLADLLIRMGKPAVRVRQSFVSAGLLVCCVCLLPAVLVQDENISLTLFYIACVAMGFFSSNHWALSQTLAGPAAAGKWTGVENCMGNFAGVVAPYVSGLYTKTNAFFPRRFCRGVWCSSCSVLLGFGLLSERQTECSGVPKPLPRLPRTYN